MQPIRVLFDQQIFLLQRFGGISRYFTELIKTFLEHPELGVVPIVESKSTFNRHLSEELASWGFSEDGSRIGTLLKILFGTIMGSNRTAKADLSHLTFYLPGYFGRNRGLPKVVTLYDMIPEKFSSRRRLWNPHFLKRHYVTKADALVSISLTSTKDMFREYEIHRDVQTTYLGVNGNFAPNLERIEGTPPSYFLYVGLRGGYKDSDTAMVAFAEISKMHPEVHLLFVGGGPLTSKEKMQLKTAGISARVTQMSIADSDLPQIYSNSIALIYTSKYEGFGLPLLEAMASGIPIVASDTEINREIAQDAANYFPTGQASALSAALQDLMANPSAQQTKIRLGLDRSKSFSWLACAKNTAEVYRSVLQRDRAKN